MPTPSPFPRTGHTIAAQPVVGVRALLVAAVVLLGAWTWWFLRARIPVYETSETARLEVFRATHPVDAPVAGRVTAVHMALDAIVAEGDVIAELDTDALRMQLAEAKARASGLGPQLVATRRAANAEEGAISAFRRESTSAIAQAKDRYREGDIQAKQAEDEARRAERLHDRGAVSEAEAVRLRAEADRRAASAAALKGDVLRIERQASTGVSDRRTRIASLQRDLALLDADLASALASTESIQHDIDRHILRAPAAGRIGEIGAMRVGSVVQIGERVATVVAEGDLRVVANFAPAAAIGRVRAGQPAQVRLDGYPWLEYGSLRAVVTDVASELRDERARVELLVPRPSNPRIPLQHGLPGTVEVTVEETSPAMLLLRAAGRLVSSPGAPGRALGAGPAPSASAAAGAP